jgi:hypothetical protein
MVRKTLCYLRISRMSVGMPNTLQHEADPSMAELGDIHRGAVSNDHKN